MDKELFQTKIKTLGEFRRQLGGSPGLGKMAYEDLIFIPHTTPNCPSCLTGHILTLERRSLPKDRTIWRLKCQHCKNFWEEKTLQKLLKSPIIVGLDK